MNNWYIQKYKWLQKHKICTKCILLICKSLTYILYVAYICAILYLLITHNLKFLVIFITIPACGFLLETGIRAKLNRPRPYEVLGIPPLQKKDTQGKSFPSRHAFSAAILSISFYFLNPHLGLLFILFSIIIGLCRIFMGVHWIKDVIAGLLFGWIFGYLGFFLFF